jgi:protease-4
VILVILVVVLALGLLSTWGMLVGMVSSMRGGSISAPGGPKVAVINITGLITSSSAGGFGGSSEGMLPVLEHLRDAEKDDSVKAILLWIDSPGGAAAASQAVYARVMEVRQKKPVVAGMGDIAASGGYYIASAATKIIAGPATETGSIGVIFHSMNVAGLMGKYGVQENVIKSGLFKDMGSPYRQMTPQEQGLLHDMIMDIYDQFVTDVASARNMPKATVQGLADGRVWTGRQALKLGLIDQLGNRDDAVKLAAQLGKINGWPAMKTYSEMPSWLKALGANSAARMPWYTAVLENPGPWLTLPVPAAGLMTQAGMAGKP